MRKVWSGVARAILDRHIIATGVSSPSRLTHIWALNNQINDRLITGNVRNALQLGVTPPSRGIGTLGGAFTKLISRSIIIPAENRHAFSTAADGKTQVVSKIQLRRTERDMAADNKLLRLFASWHSITFNSWSSTNQRSVFMKPLNMTTREYSTLFEDHLKGPHKKFRPPRKPLDGKPMMRGVILKTLIKKPKKPNSANRKCVLVRLTNGKEAVAYVPGIGHNLQEHNVVLVRCGRLQDVPGVKLKCIRGVYDLPHVIKPQRN